MTLTDDNPLVEFFRGPGFDRFGKHGDYEMWSPEQTAVHFLTEYLNATTKQEWPLPQLAHLTALAAYAQHAPGCQPSSPIEYACTCGLAALQRTESSDVR